MNTKTLTDELLKEYLTVIRLKDLSGMKLFLIDQNWLDYYDETEPAKLLRAYKHCYHRYVQDILSEAQHNVHQIIFK